jgi:uncharacterized protein YqeY
MLRDDIKKRMVAAMKAKRTVEKEILRVALGELQTAESRSGQDVSDAQAIKILKKLIKSNEESIEAVQDAERRERLVQETAILNELVPQAMDVDAIRAALAGVAEKIKAVGGDGPATGIAMKHLKGIGATVEGKDVSTVVREIRS